MPGWADQGMGMINDLDQIAIKDAINRSVGHTELDDLCLSAHVGRQNKA